MSDRRSPVAWAVAASILLHGAALGWLPGFHKSDEPPAPPLSVFIPPPPKEEQPVLIPPAAPPPPPEVSARPRQMQRQVPQIPLPVLTRAPGDAAPVDTPSIYAPAPSETPPPPVSEPVRVPVPPPRALAPDPAALSAYGKSVAGAVAAQQKYPRLAMMRKWQGTSLLQLELGADGQVRDIRVISSSGHDILDQQALDMVRAALPLPPLPATLAERPLTIDVPVVFRLTP